MTKNLKRGFHAESRYEQRELTQDWQQIRPLLKDTAQITYEVIRPVILWGQAPKERAVETSVSYRTIYYKANLFDQAGMASLLPPAPPPEIPRQDKRSLPPDIRQEIVDLHTQCGPLSSAEAVSRRSVAAGDTLRRGTRPSP